MKFMMGVRKPSINKLLFPIILFLPFWALSQKSLLNYKKYSELDITLYSVQDSLISSNAESLKNLIPCSYNHLGAFCKFENTLSKNANFPVRFRLGTVQYVDRLEFKIPAYRMIQLERR